MCDLSRHALCLLLWLRATGKEDEDGPRESEVITGSPHRRARLEADVALVHLRGCVKVDQQPPVLAGAATARLRALDAHGVERLQVAVNDALRAASSQRGRQAAARVK